MGNGKVLGATGGGSGCHAMPPAPAGKGIFNVSEVSMQHLCEAVSGGRCSRLGEATWRRPVTIRLTEIFYYYISVAYPPAQI